MPGRGDDCERCGATIETEYGWFCQDCVMNAPKCDDCDEVIPDGDYHLCEHCQARRESRMR